ncbi:MAG: hypothetical protein WC679_02310 [Bacteroidales bacterium]|jgi:hypothetical protein
MNIELIQICKEIIKISGKCNINKNATQYKELIFKETENFPNDISLSKRTIAIANNNSCTCKVCGKIHGHHDKDYCSRTCYIKNKKTNAETELSKIDKKINNAILKGEKTFKNAIENDDYLICKICGCKTGNIVNHIKYHTITLDDYKNEYDIKQIKTNKQIEKVTGVNNPAYQHGGKFSPYSDKFIYADATNKKELVEQLIKTRTENKNNTTSIDYWLKKTDGDNDLAQELLSNRQETFSKRNCIKKYGEVEGLQVWSSRQKKWQDTLNNKTPDEIKEINKKKSTKLHYAKLWNNVNFDDLGIIYLLHISNDLYKIGVTTKTLNVRYSKSIIESINVLLVMKSTISHCFYTEQLIKNKFTKFIIDKSESIDNFGWTETFRIDDINIIINKIKEYQQDETTTLEEFTTIFKKG